MVRPLNPYRKSTEERVQHHGHLLDTEDLGHVRHDVEARANGDGVAFPDCGLTRLLLR